MQIRFGSAALGALVGFVFGFLLAVVSAATGALPTISFAGWVFGTPLTLAVACFAFPSLAFLVFPGVAHFLSGVASTTSQGLSDDASSLSPEPGVSKAMRLAFYAGVAVVVGLVVSQLFQ